MATVWIYQDDAYENMIAFNKKDDAIAWMKKKASEEGYEQDIEDEGKIISIGNQWNFMCVEVPIR